MHHNSVLLGGNEPPKHRAQRYERRIQHQKHHVKNRKHYPSAIRRKGKYVQALNEFQQLNRAKLVEFFAKGTKTQRRIGFELEHVLVHKQDKTPVSYFEPGGVRDVLERLAPAFDEVTYEGENIIALMRPSAGISIEPAGQLEISAGPFKNVLEVEQAYLDFRNLLDPILDEFGLETPMLGYHPYAKAKELELVPKERYTYMNEFLGAQSYYGVGMMRGTASLQISVDFEDEADAMRKFRIAEMISPILALICDNSPVFEAEESETRLVRTALWAGMNQDRVGCVPGSLDKDFGFADYADYILTREAILVPDPDSDHGFIYVGDKTFDEIYADREMSLQELEHALSMVWPDARLKNFVEIRPADAMPFEYALAYTVLILALFYSNRNLNVLETLLADVTEEQVREAKQELIAKGYGATVYGRNAAFWADMLITLASGSLLSFETPYFEPLASLVAHRQTLAGVWPRIREKRSMAFEGNESAPVIGIVPRYDFEWAGTSMHDGYSSGLLETGAVPIILPLTSDPKHIDRIVRACDGFLIPGGQDIDPSCYGARRKPHTHRSATARDNMERALIPAVLKAHKPILGICRGMQSLNVVLGGTLHQDINAEVADSSESHEQPRPYNMPAHMLNLVEGSRLAAIVGAPRIGVNTLHHQSVDKLGEGLVVSAMSDDGVIEGIELAGDDFVVGVQWHPEHMWRRRPHSKRLFAALVEAASKSRQD